MVVLGASPDPSRPSHEVAQALIRWGYEVIPVRPGIQSLYGRPAFGRLAEIRQPVDVLDVFRRSEHVRQHLPEIIDLKPRVLWLQDGVRDDATAEAATEAGILVVQDDCLARRIGGLIRAGGS